MKPAVMPSSPRRAAILAALVVLWAGPGSIGPEAQVQSRQRLSGADRGQIQILARLVDSVARGQISAPSDVGLYWTNHFLRAPNNLVYVPYAINLDGAFDAPTVTMYIRAVRRGAATGAYDQSKMTMGSWRNLTERPAQLTGDLKDIRANSPKDPYAFEDGVVWEGLDDRVGRALWVPPGEYDVYVAMQGRGGGGKSAVIVQHLSVPDYSKEFSASTVILAERLEVESESDARLAEDAFTVSGLQIVPLGGSTLDAGRTLDVVFCIYNESLDVEGKPDVEVEYGFYRKLGDAATEVFFNRTLPKKFTAETVPPDFDLAAGHQILVVQSVPLASFPDGDYRLEIKVFDHVSANLIHREVNFSVTGS